MPRASRCFRQDRSGCQGGQLAGLSALGVEPVLEAVGVAASFRALFGPGGVPVPLVDATRRS